MRYEFESNSSERGKRKARGKEGAELDDGKKEASATGRSRRRHRRRSAAAAAIARRQDLSARQNGHSHGPFCLSDPLFGSIVDYPVPNLRNQRREKVVLVPIERRENVQARGSSGGGFAIEREQRENEDGALARPPPCFSQSLSTLTQKSIVREKELKCISASESDDEDDEESEGLPRPSSRAVVVERSRESF